MKEIFDIKNKIERIRDVEPFNQAVLTGDVSLLYSELSSFIKLGKIEVLSTQNYFISVGAKVVEALKSMGAEVSVLLIENKDNPYSFIKANSTKNVSACVAIGDSFLLSFSRYYTSLNLIPCYAVPTTPDLENLLKSYVLLNTQGLPAKMEVKAFKKIVIDETLISNAPYEVFAKSYISVMNKLTALIDYRINSYLSGQAVDNKLFEMVKNSINIVAMLPKYENFKSAIIYSQMVLLSVNSISTMLEGTGEQVVKIALDLFAPKMLEHEKEFLAFEKLSKIYHFYFSNDFSDLLVVPDYYGELKILQEHAKRDISAFSKNLKIPSERRRVLINLLLEKTSKEFKAETITILSILKQVKKIYENLLVKSRKGSKPSYKQVKSAITLSTYLTDKTSVLTLCRDAGILKCAN